MRSMILLFLYANNALSRIERKVDGGSRMSVKEGLSLLEERRQMCVDYVFLSALRVMLRGLEPGCTLDDAQLEQLTELCFDYLRHIPDR
jgi:hypothetical protein